MKYAPWSAWQVQFSPHVGREQGFERPALVVGSAYAAELAERTGLVIVVPCSTKDKGWAWHPRIHLGGVPGAALCDQIKTISTQRIIAPWRGAGVTADDIERVQRTLRKLLSL